MMRGGEMTKNPAYFLDVCVELKNTCRARQDLVHVLRTDTQKHEQRHRGSNSIDDPASRSATSPTHALNF